MYIIGFKCEFSVQGVVMETKMKMLYGQVNGFFHGSYYSGNDVEQDGL